MIPMKITFKVMDGQGTTSSIEETANDGYYLTPDGKLMRSAMLQLSEEVNDVQVIYLVTLPPGYEIRKKEVGHG